MKKTTIIALIGLSALVGGCSTLDAVDQALTDTLDFVDAVMDPIAELVDTGYQVDEYVHSQAVTAASADCARSFTDAGFFDDGRCRRWQEAQREHEAIKRERHRYDTLAECVRKRGPHSREDCRAILGLQG